MIKSRFMFLLAGVVTCTAFCLNAEAKLYKWVDDSGTTHYGETIPPEYANRGAKQLDKGRITDRNENFDSDKLKLNKPESEADKAALEASRHDEALLNSYSNEKEIDLARDRNLMQVEARVNSYSTVLKSAQASLDDLHRESDSRTKAGHKVPQSLTEDIAAAQARVADLQKNLDASQKEMISVKARYDADKQRYHELKGQPPGSSGTK
jgi:chromosome segregation ATPase